MFLAYQFSCPAPVLWRFRVVCAFTLSLLVLGGCSYSDSRLIRHKVVVDGLVGTTMDADVFQSSISRSVGVDFGAVRVFAGSEDGLSQFWPSSMVEHYETSGISQCFSKPGISIRELETGLYHVKARFHIPRALVDLSEHSEHALAWLEKCDCLKEKDGASCFEDYAIREIEKKLTKKIGNRLGGTEQANILLSDVRQMKRRLGTFVQTRRRILTDELGIFQRLTDDNVIPHNIESLDPGKKFCYQSYSYNRGIQVTGGSLVSALVPGSLSCIKWLGVVRPNSDSKNVKDILTGFDPITPLGKGWKDRENNLYFKPIYADKFNNELDYRMSLNRIVYISKSSFPFGILFKSNDKQTILISDSEDLKINDITSETLRHGNILLLFKDAALKDFVQQHYTCELGNDKKEGFGYVSDGMLHQFFHACVTNLVDSWIKQTGKNKAEPEDYFLGFVMRPSIYVKPVYADNFDKGLDYWAPLDRVVNNSETSFPFGLLFTSNYKRTILIPDSEDLDIDGKSSETVRRGNILLLFKDAGLRDFVQQHYAFESPKNSNVKYACISDGTTHMDFHICIKTLVAGWLNFQKDAPESPKGDPENYFHDLVMPSNIRPFTQIPIYLNGEVRWVRSGSSVLNILDEKFRLTEEVMQARAAETISELRQPHNEAELVKRALSKFSLKRRLAGHLVDIQFNEVQSLNGLALPLTPGDELSW